MPLLFSVDCTAGPTRNWIRERAACGSLAIAICPTANVKLGGASHPKGHSRALLFPSGAGGELSVLVEFIQHRSGFDRDVANLTRLHPISDTASRAVDDNHLVARRALEVANQAVEDTREYIGAQQLDFGRPA